MNTAYDDDAMESAKQEFQHLLPFYVWNNGVGTFVKQPVPKETVDRLLVVARQLRG